MRHLGTKTIVTERLILRKFTVDDGENMYKNWASDNEVTKFLTWPPHNDVSMSKSIIELWIKETKMSNNYQWCIELKEIKEAIGSISVVHINELIEAVEIGYCMGKDYWNQGLMTEAFQAIIHFFFLEVGVSEIKARHDIKNTASGKVMIKCGLKFEGMKYQAATNNTGICDLACYAILRDDYYNTEN